MNKLLRIGILAVVTTTTGCASIVNGQNQSLSIETKKDSAQIAGANCKLSNDKGTWFVTTPGSTIVHRSYQDLAVRCEKDGVNPGSASIKSSTKPMAFGNVIFGGAIGAGVDVITGSAYDYPSLITIEMDESTPAPQPLAAAVPQEQSAKN